MFKNSSEIFAYIKKEDVKLVDVRFTDLPGIQHHFNVPVESFDEAVFTDGLMFDGSSIRGFQSIHESDMKLLPVPSSAYLDPFRLEKTLIIIFSVHNRVQQDLVRCHHESLAQSRLWGIAPCESALSILWCRERRSRMHIVCLLYTSPSPRDGLLSRMPSSA